MRLMTFDGRTLAKAWLSVAEASSSNPDQPALNRTVAVEHYDTGVRLVATDTYILLTAWVPALSPMASDAPGLDEVANGSVVAIDRDGRAKGLMSHLRKITKAAEAPDVLVSLDVGTPPPDIWSPPAMFDDDREVLTIAADGREALILDLYAGEWVRWRPMVVGHKAMRMASVALSPHILGRVAKVAALYDDAIEWHFAGTEQGVLIRVGPVEGIVIPVRWTGAAAIVGGEPGGEAAEPVQRVAHAAAQAMRDAGYEAYVS